MRIVFLDLDGVLATLATRYDYFEPRCLRLLKELVEETDAHIVITSAWRKRHYLESMRKVFELDGDEDLLLYGVKRYEGPRMGFPIKRIIGLTPFSTREMKDGVPFGRGHEISMWLERAKGKTDIESYVVLDDEKADIAPHVDRLVQSNSYLGLTHTEIDEAKRILMGS